MSPEIRGIPSGPSSEVVFLHEHKTRIFVEPELRAEGLNRTRTQSHDAEVVRSGPVFIKYLRITQKNTAKN